MTRREPRELALEALYEIDQRQGDEIHSDLTGRARRLVEGVVAERDALDRALGGVSTSWKVERMPTVDRNILRLGLYELRNMPDTPAAVILAEAVKLAKKYSTEKSGAFVNGVLAKLATDLRGSDSAEVDGPPAG